MISADRAAAPARAVGGTRRVGRRLAVLGALGCLGSAAAACGRKGDLVAPPEPAAAGAGQDGGREGAGG
jgi:predicted small lipoprotein YifL